MRARSWPPAAWFLLAGIPLLLFFVLYGLPVLQLFRLSFDRFDPGPGIIPAFSVDFYTKFLGDGYYLSILWRTVRISLGTTVIAAVIAYPVSFYLLASSGWRQTLLLIVLILPLVTSMIVVSYGWLILLGPERSRQQDLDRPGPHHAAAEAHVQRDRHPGGAGPGAASVHGALGLDLAAGVDSNLFARRAAWGRAPGAPSGSWCFRSACRACAPVRCWSSRSA